MAANSPNFNPGATGTLKTKTELSITGTIVNGTFSIAASGGSYVHSGDVANFVNSTDFANDEKTIIQLNSIELDSADVSYVSTTSFTYIGTVDNGDRFTILILS